MSPPPPLPHPHNLLEEDVAVHQPMQPGLAWHVSPPPTLLARGGLSRGMQLVNESPPLTIASLLPSSDYILRDRGVLFVGEDQALNPLSRPPARSAVAHRSSEETNFKEIWFDDGYSVSHDQKSGLQIHY